LVIVFDTTDFGNRKNNSIAWLQGVEHQTLLYFEIFGDTATARADRAG